SSTCFCRATISRASRRFPRLWRRAEASAARPLRFRLGPLGEHVVQRALRLVLLAEEVFESGLPQVTCRRDQVFQRLPCLALQSDAESRQDGRVRVRKTLRHLDLGKSLLRSAKQLVVLAETQPKLLVIVHQASFSRAVE